MTDLTPDQFLGGGGDTAPPHAPPPKYTPFVGKGATPDAFMSAGAKPVAPSTKPTPGFDWQSSLKGVFKSLQSAGGTVDALIEDPKTQLEAIKGLAKGAIDMGSAAAGGLKGAYEAVRGGDFRLNEELTEKQVNRKATEITQGILHVNLAPVGKEGETITNLLGLLPQGIHKLGELSNDTTVKALTALGTDQYHAALAGATAEAGITAAATWLTFKPETAVKLLKPLLADDTAIAPVRKLTKQIESAFDSLVAKDAPAAEDLIKHVEPAEPAVAKKLKVRMKSLKPPEVIGAARVNARVGDFDAMEKHAETLWTPLSKELESRGLFQPDTDTSAHKLLDQAIPLTSHPYVRGLLEHIRANVDDVPIKHRDFTGTGDWRRGLLGVYYSDDHSVELTTRTGDPLIHYESKAVPTETRLQTAVHEIVHAGTVRFMEDNKAHPLAKEIKALWLTARARAAGMDLYADRVGPIDLSRQRGWVSSSKHYGLTNEKEFVAEALSNPNFQRWLADSEDFARPSAEKNIRDSLRITKPPTILNKLINAIAGIFKVKDPGQLTLLHNIFNTTRDIMEAQKAGLPTTEQVGSGIRSAMQEVHGMADAKEPKPLGEDPTLYLDRGKSVSQGKVEAAFRIGAAAADRVPGMGVAKGELKTWYEWAVRKVNPEALGPEAKLGAAIVAKNVAKQAQHESSVYHKAADRRTFWNMRQKEARDFIAKFESGATFADPVLNKAAEGYRNWAAELAARDHSLGIEYAPQDNYLFHVYEQGDQVAQFMQQKFKSKWGDPGFIKDRAFDMYEEARRAGFTPKYTNPEDIMLARDHASAVAEMQVNTLRELEQHGLAVRIEKGSKPPEDYPATERRAPNGERFWVHSDAHQILHNAFDSKSLWSDPTPVGKTFRGAMALKNTIVPIKLAVSMFHPIHVQTIHNITNVLRAWKEFGSGRINLAEWLWRTGKGLAYTDLVSAPIEGSHILRAFQGKLKDSEFTAADRQSLEYMAEGGMIPELSSQYRTKAWQSFRDSVDKRQVRAVFKAPLGVLDKLQGVIFQKWIPALKTYSYLKDVETALKTDPSLKDDSGRRMQAFRKLAKSVDNRYGEMAYNTLFWDRMVKDLSVANTLSLGWQLGFMREYGGGMLDIGQWVGGGAKLQAVRSGKLDRPLFVAMYTTQAMAYGGLLTYASTGKPPQKLIDYIDPIVGYDSKGQPKRVTTMFYTREFMSIYKHTKAEGAVQGIESLVESKGSGVMGLAKEWATGVDAFGQEIADPNAPAYKQLEQKLAFTLSGLEPISLGTPAPTAGDRALSVAGFNPAPKYITQSDTQNRISAIYRSRYAPKETPFDKAQRSTDMRSLRAARDAGDMNAYDDQLTAMQAKYDLTGSEMNKLRAQSRSKSDPSVRMFSSFTWQDQRALLDKMTPEERLVYLPHSNKDHLRRKYKPPDQGDG